MKRIILALLVCTILAGCGGGSTTADIPTPAGTPVNLQVVKALSEGTATGTAFYANISGTDGNGTNYNGKISMSADGPMSFEGQSVTRSTSVTSLTNLSTGVSISGSTYNYHRTSDSSLYKSTSSTGRIYLPVDPGLPLPLVANIGDSGSLGRTTYDATTTELTKWNIDAGVNGNALLVFSYYIQNSSGFTVSLEIDTYYISPIGTVYRLDTELTQNGVRLFKLSGNVTQGA